VLEEISFDGGCLRPWQEDDAFRLVQAWADAEIAGWNAVPPEPTLATASHWIDGQQQRLDRMLSVDMVIDIDHAEGIVGEVGLSSFSEYHRAALIGYWLLPEARGQGIATAAVRAFTDWAQDRFDLETIIARCHQDNSTSQAVAERAGFRHEANDDSSYQLWISRTREK